MICVHTIAAARTEIFASSTIWRAVCPILTMSARSVSHKRHVLLRWIRPEPIPSPILELGRGIGTFARQLGKRLSCRCYRYLRSEDSKSPVPERQTRRQPATLVQHLSASPANLGRASALDLDSFNRHIIGQTCGRLTAFWRQTCSSMCQSRQSDRATSTSPVSAARAFFYVGAIAAVCQCHRAFLDVPPGGIGTGVSPKWFLMLVGR